MTNFVMQVLKDKVWTNINRGNEQYKRTWEVIKDGLPVRVLHKVKIKDGVSGRSYKVVKNIESLPEGFEASGFEVALGGYAPENSLS